ncbi:MAG: HPF/RaiA family ribosome-associated protein [Pleurocapsa sp.]
MKTLANPLITNYLALEETLEVDSLIKDKFSRLSQVCHEVQNCQVKVANIARHKAKKTNYAYLVSINLSLPEGVELYTLRSPQPEAEDSLQGAIADAFARIYRQLIELQLKKNIVHG